MKPIAGFDNFEKLDIRIGRITAVEDAATKKPTYRLRIDFGPEIGVKVSCGAFRNYEKHDLVGRQIVGVINFGQKKMGPEISEVLVLGVPGEGGATIFLTPQSEVELGVAVF
ncbi:protein secretion chaperonin CsaA [Sorangium sp. So ce1099]|uniref:protein secretion chaperonin CsaA n=1 Tax=Sorangium sp. So ce1099 TaxID=3133331 RepID=UPI003F5EF22C